MQDAKGIGLGAAGHIYYLTAYGEPAQLPMIQEPIYMINA